MLNISYSDSTQEKLEYEKFDMKRRSRAIEIQVTSGVLHSFNFAGLCELYSFKASQVQLRDLVNVNAKTVPKLTVFKAPGNELSLVNNLLNLPVIQVIDLSYNRIEAFQCDDDTHYTLLKMDHNPFVTSCRMPRARQTAKEDVLWTEVVFKFVREHPECVLIKDEKAEQERKEDFTNRVFGL